MESPTSTISTSPTNEPTLMIIRSPCNEHKNYLSETTEVLLVTGESRKCKDLRIGDILISGDGTPQIISRIQIKLLQGYYNIKSPTIEFETDSDFNLEYFTDNSEISVSTSVANICDEKGMECSELKKFLGDISIPFRIDTHEIDPDMAFIVGYILVNKKFPYFFLQCNPYTYEDNRLKKNGKGYCCCSQSTIDIIMDPMLYIMNSYRIRLDFFKGMYFSFSELKYIASNSILTRDIIHLLLNSLSIRYQDGAIGVFIEPEKDSNFTIMEENGQIFGYAFEFDFSNNPDFLLSDFTIVHQ
jgi:hypothetical protein